MDLARPFAPPTAPEQEADSTRELEEVFTGFPVKLPGFEGPLDLLLYLIRREEVEPEAIPVALILQQYLEWLLTLEKVDVEGGGSFIVMAASVLEIKSGRLLPREQQPEQEEEGEDPSAELARRLVEYRRYREAAARLREQWEERARSFSRGLLKAEPQEEEDFRLAGRLSAFDLWAAFQEILGRAKAAPPGQIVRPRVTVAQRIAELSNRLLWAEEGLRFAELFAQDVMKCDVIVTFLALLELIRLGRVRVRQERAFGEIWLERRREVSASGAPA
jgi:segregation and condensation protein A